MAHGPNKDSYRRLKLAVAQRYSECLTIKRSWVKGLPGTGLSSILLSIHPNIRSTVDCSVSGPSMRDITRKNGPLSLLTGAKQAHWVRKKP